MTTVTSPPDEDHRVGSLLTTAQETEPVRVAEDEVARLQQNVRSVMGDHMPGSAGQDRIMPVRP